MYLIVFALFLCNALSNEDLFNWMKWLPLGEYDSITIYINHDDYKYDRGNASVKSVPTRSLDEYIRINLHLSSMYINAQVHHFDNLHHESYNRTPGNLNINELSSIVIFEPLSSSASVEYLLRKGMIHKTKIILYGSTIYKNDNHYLLLFHEYIIIADSIKTLKNIILCYQDNMESMIDSDLCEQIEQCKEYIPRSYTVHNYMYQRRGWLEYARNNHYSDAAIDKLEQDLVDGPLLSINYSETIDGDYVHTTMYVYDSNEIAAEYYRELSNTGQRDFGKYETGEIQKSIEMGRKNTVYSLDGRLLFKRKYLKKDYIEQKKKARAEWIKHLDRVDDQIEH